MMDKTNRSTLHTVYITTYNSLPRRAAMTRHTDCHARQQQQPGLAGRVYAARNRRRQGFCQQSDQVGFYLASIHHRDRVRGVV